MEAVPYAPRRDIAAPMILNPHIDIYNSVIIMPVSMITLTYYIRALVMFV